jgi:hypothetical protein
VVKPEPPRGRGGRLARGSPATLGQAARARALAVPRAGKPVRRQGAREVAAVWEGSRALPGVLDRGVTVGLVVWLVWAAASEGWVGLVEPGLVVPWSTRSSA